ncbi:MAG: CDP-alcohol phosphatidyltransferase family protein [Patescibacteria group bacterium]
MHLPKWFRRSLLWCRQTFEGLTRWKEELIYRFLRLPVVEPVFRYITPNDLCYLRMFAGVSIIFLYLRGYYGTLLPVFAFAVVLDFIDGPLARSSGRVSDEGKVLDANADKVLVLIPLLLIGYDRLNGQLVTWLMVVELFLFLVANYLKPVLRGRYGIPLVSGSNAFGQIKMMLESVAVGIILYNPAGTVTTSIGQALMFLSICFGIMSLLRHLGRLDRGIRIDPQKRLITVPNLISLGSLFLFIPAGFSLGAGEYLTATVYIVLAFVSDFFDGYLARRLHQVTHFGAALDPFRDFVGRLFITAWMFALMPPLIRVVLVATVLTESTTAVLNLRTSYQRRKMTPVTRIAQWRTVVQYTLFGIALLYLADILPLSTNTLLVVFFAIFLASLASLISYTVQRSRLLAEDRTGNPKL